MASHIVQVIGGRIMIRCHLPEYRRGAGPARTHLVAWDHVTEVQAVDESECLVHWTGDQHGDTWVVNKSMTELVLALEQAAILGGIYGG